MSPLRICAISRVGPTDRVTLLGCDRPAAETIVHLITGAAVPDEGSVRIAGHDTRSIATDTEWLSSLDRFGIVTERAMLLESLPVAANLAIPITLAIDPMSAETRAEVERLADLVGPRAGDASTSGPRRSDAARPCAPAPGPRVRAEAGDAAARAGDRAPSPIRPRARSSAVCWPRPQGPASTGWIALTDDAEFAARGRRPRPALQSSDG